MCLEANATFLCEEVFFFKSKKCDQPELTRMYSVVRKV